MANMIKAKSVCPVTTAQKFAAISRDIRLSVSSLPPHPDMFHRQCPANHDKEAEFSETCQWTNTSTVHKAGNLKNSCTKISSCPCCWAHLGSHALLSLWWYGIAVSATTAPAAAKEDPSWLPHLTSMPYGKWMPQTYANLPCFTMGYKNFLTRNPQTSRNHSVTGLPAQEVAHSRDGLASWL